MTIILFSKALQLHVDSRKEKKIEKKIFVFQIIAFELGFPNSRNIEKANCPWQSMC